MWYQVIRDKQKRRLKGARGTSASEKPLILGIVQRNAMLVLRVLDNVQLTTIQPIIEKHIKKKTLIYTDEYNIYSRLKQRGYKHKTVCHAKGEYARNENGDGKYEVHLNTQEGI